VLANEQVDSQGRSWRSGALVQKVKLKQWFLKITTFKEILLNDLDHLLENGKWPERVVTQQRNWLGKSVGAKLKFVVQVGNEEETDVSVYTTRPDTIFGVHYLALSLSHPLVAKLAAHDVELQTFVDGERTSTANDKAGFALKDIVARNPAAGLLKNSSGSAHESLPIFVAPYVLSDYGEGAVMGVPAHDERDFAFWRKHRPDADVSAVISPSESVSWSSNNRLKEAYTGHGFLTSLCGEYEGRRSQDAAQEIVKDLRTLGKAEAIENWRLRDWLISRQRYWGTPIPIVHCESCGAVPVKDEELPVELPKLDGTVKGTTGNPLDKMSNWVKVPCPSCSRPARRDTDTMDTFVDSSWYFLRFPDAHNQLEPFSKNSAATKLPVDTYVGGVEHAILHLLYARFIYKFLSSEDLMTPDASQSIDLSHSEPFSQLIAQGMVHGKTFSHPGTGRFLLPQEMSTDADGNAIVRDSGQRPLVTWEKMSKSKHNGVSPETVIDRWGADVVRAHILFAAPVGEVLQWDDEKIVGIERWFSRISRLVATARTLSTSSVDETSFFKDTPDVEAADIPTFLILQSTISSIARTFESDLYSLNTVVSDLTKLTNHLTDIKLENLSPWLAFSCTSSLLRMLAPIGPAFAEQCWEDLHPTATPDELGSIFENGWPQYKLSNKLKERIDYLMSGATLTCVVHVNGKPRFSIDVPASIMKQDKELIEQSLVDSASATKEGGYWFKEQNDWSKRKRVVVAKGGKMLNIVF
jgi:leucyl-tRNA synthetase